MGRGERYLGQRDLEGRGQVGEGGIDPLPYGGTARAIGQPLLGIGGEGYGGSVGDYHGIGLGYLHAPTEKYPCEIGCQITNDVP